MSFVNIDFAPSAAIAASGGTATISYPTGYDKGHFLTNNARHRLVVNGDAKLAPADFTLAFAAANITLTNNGSAIPAGTPMRLSLQTQGRDDLTAGSIKVFDNTRAALMQAVLVNLGSPDAAAANNICLSQTVNSTAAVLNGALASGGVATLDAPRNVVAAWTGAGVLTVTGTDQYGNTVVEASASGTSFTGKKAFKTITSAVFNANVTAATVGTGDVLGLPFFLPSTALILAQLEDGATASAGTAVAGATAKATSTTGDVRGTYDPASACNGDKGFQLLVAVSDPNDRGAPQFTG